MRKRPYWCSSKPEISRACIDNHLKLPRWCADRNGCSAKERSALYSLFVESSSRLTTRVENISSSVQQALREIVSEIRRRVLLRTHHRPAPSRLQLSPTPIPLHCSFQLPCSPQQSLVRRASRRPAQEADGQVRRCRQWGCDSEVSAEQRQCEYSRERHPRSDDASCVEAGVAEK